MKRRAVDRPFVPPRRRRPPFRRQPWFSYGGRYTSPVEMKFHDVDLDDAVVATGGTVTASVNLIPQGVTEKTRIGRKCNITRINWRWNITLPETDAVATASPGDVIRMIMYLDKQANGATAAVTDILESASYLSYNNLVNKGRFQTLMDRKVTINYLSLASDGAGVVSSASVTKTGRFHKKCNIPIEFNAGTGAITEIRSNNIGVLLISVANQLAFTSKIRLRFSD